MYTAVVLTEESHNKLLALFGHLWGTEEGWKPIAHHMTLHMGKATEEEIPLLGKFVTLVIDAVAGNEKVKAARVSLTWEKIKSANAVPHITLAINKQKGGKPVMSNELTDWQSLENPIYLRGQIEEVTTN